MIRSESVDAGAPRTPRPAQLRSVCQVLGALQRWWRIGRHYRPERRYMRG